MQVTKRDGRVMEFCKERIVDAITKAMNQTAEGVDVDLANKIAQSIEKQLETRDEVTVYEIQDLVEKKLMASSRKEVATEYITYRYIRDVARKSKTREVFLDIITSKSNYFRCEKNENILDTPDDMMKKFAAETIKPYVDTFLLSEETRKAEKYGYINILSKSYYPTKSINSFQIPFCDELNFFKDCKNIESIVNYISILITKLKDEVDGSLSIPAVDYLLAPYVKATFEEEVLKVQEDLELKCEKYIFPKDYIYAETKGLSAENKIIQIAINRTISRVHNSLKNFIVNISSKKKDIFYNSINYGTDTSPEGRCVIREILGLDLESLEKDNALIQIWKKKKGINYLPDDKNYDLYELLMKLFNKKSFFNFINLDATFNANKKWQEDDARRCYYECANISDFRVFENRFADDNSIGRGVISSVTIDLPKISLESLTACVGDLKFNYDSNCKNDLNIDMIMDVFWSKLKFYIDVALNTLLERFNFQATAVKNQFPELMSGLWCGSNKLYDDDTIKDVISYGTLNLGITGLAECLITLTQKHHGESKIAQDLGLEIIRKIKAWVDEFSEKYNLNFCLMQSEDYIGRFVMRDRMSYGYINDVTDKDEYTYGTSIPENFECSIEEKIKIEAPYQELCKGGSSFILNKNVNEDSIKDVISLMDKYNLGCICLK